MSAAIFQAYFESLENPEDTVTKQMRICCIFYAFVY